MCFPYSCILRCFNFRNLPERFDSFLISKIRSGQTLIEFAFSMVPIDGHVNVKPLGTDMIRLLSWHVKQVVSL